MDHSLIMKRTIKRAIRLAGSERALADMARVSQPAINKAKHRGYVTAEMAVLIDKALAPDVTKEQLRPDLWPSKRLRSAA